MVMMIVTERQKEILNRIVADYIDLAQPVSSEFLEEKHHFGICPATIRIEMQKLTDTGFLYQPHTSAGRVPTDKGYRFFVDNLFARQNFVKQNLGGFEKGFPKEKTLLKVEDLIEREMGDGVRFLQSLTKNLASFSSNSLALGYLFDEDLFWKEGWEDVLGEPEFKETKVITDFADVIKHFEKEIEDIKINSGIKVYIGKENPFSKVKDFSIIISKCHFPNDGKGVLAIAGPKRMAYDKNINSLNSLTKLLETL